jgi:hypothetical protein
MQSEDINMSQRRHRLLNEDDELELPPVPPEDETEEALVPEGPPGGAAYDLLRQAVKAYYEEEGLEDADVEDAGPADESEIDIIIQELLDVLRAACDVKGEEDLTGDVVEPQPDLE